MQGRRLWVVIAAVAVVVASGIALAGMALGGEESDASAAEYQVVVVNVRDRTDFALGRLSKAQSFDELLERMDEASAAINGAVGELEEATPPAELADVHAELAGNLEAMATDIQSTADQARVPGFEDLFQGASGLNFETWDAVNENLAAMEEAGVVVAPLSRKTT